MHKNKKRQTKKSHRTQGGKRGDGDKKETTFGVSKNKGKQKSRQREKREKKEKNGREKVKTRIKKNRPPWAKRHKWQILVNARRRKKKVERPSNFA